MRSSVASTEPHFSPWPHRGAVALVCATFPLIWVGGLVTTYEAGMAVPDWPTTYGYNLFLYPWQTWIYGPWDLFIEHGHRLLGAATGILAIALVALVWKLDGRVWVRAMSLLTLAAVIAQGIIGGMRVRMDERTLAQIHGCVGPAFFALAVTMAVITSRRWVTASRDEAPKDAARFQRLAIVTTALVYAQIVIGSQIRHVRPEITPQIFRLAVVFHVLLAVVLAVHACWLAASGVLRHRTSLSIVTPAVALAALVAAQFALGCAVWVLNFGWPTAWLGEYAWTEGLTVVQEGRVQALATTAHVAGGSLILAVSVLVTLRSLRLWRSATGRTVLQRRIATVLA